MAALLPSLHSSGQQAPMSTLQLTGLLTQPSLASPTLASSNPTGLSQSFSTNYMRQQKRRLPARLEPISPSSRQTVPPPTQTTSAIEEPRPQTVTEISSDQEQELYQKAVENLQRRIDEGEKGAALVLGKLHFEMVQIL